MKEKGKRRRRKRRKRCMALTIEQMGVMIELEEEQCIGNIMERKGRQKEGEKGKEGETVGVGV